MALADMHDSSIMREPELHSERKSVANILSVPNGDFSRSCIYSDLKMVKYRVLPYLVWSNTNCDVGNESNVKSAYIVLSLF
jgi:hypothetical protein